MGNPLGEALDMARDAAKQLKEAGKKVSEYRGDDGTFVLGWNLHYYLGRIPEDQSFSRAIGDWEEYSGTHYLVLGTDGRIYDYDTFTTEYGAARTGGHRIERARRLRPATQGELLSLGPGKPFAALKTMLERLPWQ